MLAIVPRNGIGRQVIYYPGGFPAYQLLYWAESGAGGTGDCVVWGGTGVAVWGE